MKDLGLSKEDFFCLALIPLFLLLISIKVPTRTEKERPNCVPDYRPGYKCMVFEKQPY